MTAASPASGSGQELSNPPADGITNLRLSNHSDNLLVSNHKICCCISKVMATIESSTSTPQLEEIITEDGILSLIVSSLPLIQAVRTSILSKRWRHIWTCRSEFNFDAHNVLDAHYLGDLPIDGIEAYMLLRGKTSRYIRSVNSILQQLQGVHVDQFIIRYFLHQTNSRHLNSWVRFAVASRAKMLRVHLFKRYASKRIQKYEFPCQLLGSSEFIEKFSLISCSFKLPCKFDGLNRLKLLAWNAVEVNEKDFNCIVSNCSSTLEKLGLWDFPAWESIVIPHPLSQLDTLLVQDCEKLRKVQINAPNLLKFQYRGAPLDFRFRQSMQLNEAEICFNTEGTTHNLGFYLSTLSNSLPHLRTLTLKISAVSKMADLPKGSTSFTHLTHLDVDWDVNVRMSLLDLATLLDAAPYIEELKLQLLEQAVEQQPKTPSKLQEVLPKHSHTHLKTIEISGFYFDGWQSEIAVYLLNNAPQLKSMTIKTCSNCKPTKEIGETNMKNLSEKASSNAKIVIL